MSTWAKCRVLCTDFSRSFVIFRLPGTLDRATIDEQLAAPKKAIFERALGGELAHHLGYEKGQAKPAGSTNHRNGTSRKRVTTDDNLLDVEIPRDREGTFDPVLIAKGEQRFTGFDDKIIVSVSPAPSRRSERKLPK